MELETGDKSSDMDKYGTLITFFIYNIQTGLKQMKVKGEF
jgi:hypothetical protein